MSHIYFYLESVICGERLVAKFTLMRFAGIDGPYAHETFAVSGNVLDQLPLGRILLTTLRTLLFLHLGALLLFDVLSRVRQRVQIQHRSRLE